MKIAIIGAGFCGLACAWYLSKEAEVTLFDPLEIGKGTSGIAAGLLHPYSGAHSKKNRFSDEGMAATLELLKISEETLQSSVYRKSGMIRPALSLRQKEDFSLAAQKHPQDIIWKDVTACNALFPTLPPFEGIYVEPTYVVNCEKYLQGLWKACSTKGVQLIQEKVDTLEGLDHFDRIIITAGWGTPRFTRNTPHQFNLIKGQILRFERPREVPHLPCPLNSQAYLIDEPATNSVLLGATFERSFQNEHPEPSIAMEDLVQKAQPFFPYLDVSNLLECRAGIRLSAKNHLPLCEKIDTKCWLLTGMGSKGLLYHALYAQQLSKNILPK